MMPRNICVDQCVVGYRDRLKSPGDIVSYLFISVTCVYLIYTYVLYAFAYVS